MADSRPSAIVSFVRAHLLHFAYALVALVLFGWFLIASLPYTDVVSQAIGSSGLVLSSRSQHSVFPFGVEMNDVSLTDGAHPERPPLLQTERMSLRPTFLAMLTGSPAVTVRANLYGGVLNALVKREQGEIMVDFNAEGLHLDRYPGLRDNGITLNGIASASGTAFISPVGLTADNGTIHVIASDASVAAPLVSLLKFGAVESTINLDHGKVNLTELTSNGADVTLSANGAIELKPIVEDSIVGVKFELQLSDDAKNRLGFLTNFLPHPPGTAPYFISGTFRAPRLS